MEQASAPLAGTRQASLAQLVALSFRIQAVTTDTNDLERIMSALLSASIVQLNSLKKSGRAKLLLLLTQSITDKTLWINALRAIARTK